MKILSHPRVLLGVRIYIIAGLIAAAIMSPPALAVIVLLLLLMFIFLWWRFIPNTSLMLDYFIFYALAILLAQRLNSLVSPLLALPVLLLFNRDLEENARRSVVTEPKRKYRVTSVGLTLAITTSLALGGGMMLGNTALIVSSIFGIIYLVIIGSIVIYKMPPQPVTAAKLTLRMVAESKNSYLVAFTPQTNLGSRFWVSSPYEWLKIADPQFVIKDSPTEEDTLTSEITITPPLSGPTVVKLEGTLIDRWGLIQTYFDIEPCQMYVIPRARYAEWLAKKYLAETKSGTLPLVSTVGVIKPLAGLRRGIEYYGSQLYQPGDSLKNIDWKHSIKYDKLISKEFADFHGQEAIMLINLVVGNADEADKQAYNIIMTALSLAREQIPTAIAAYNDKETFLVTNTLPPNQLVARALDIITNIMTIKNPLKYLGHPDIIRLRANINRLHYGHNPASSKLAELLEIEYNNLKSISKTNPATQTINTAMNKVGKQASLVILTQSNHDTEAIEFNRYLAFTKGNTVMTI